MTHPRRWFATALIAALALTGCGKTPAEPAPSATATATTSAPATVAPIPGVSDALSLTGPVTAEAVPDVTPVAGTAEPKLPATIKDATGKEITVAKASRILALDLFGTLTDTVIGMGLAERLVGRANSDTQAVLKDLPVVTKGGHDLNIEAVLNLKPDLVLTNTTIGSARIYDQLEQSGITVVRFEQTPSMAKIGETINQVGVALGLTDAAKKLADDVAQKMAAAQAEVKQLQTKTPRKPRAIVLYVRGTAGVFFILGEDHGASDVISALGLADAAKENNVSGLTPANAESLVSLNPEIILAMSGGVESTGGIDGLLARPGVGATTAGENKRIVMAADTQLLSYGPRTPANLVALARAIYLAPSS